MDVALDQSANVIHSDSSEDTNKDGTERAPYTMDAPNIQSVIPAHFASKLDCSIANKSADDTNGRSRPRLNITGCRCDRNESSHCSGHCTNHIGLTFSRPIKDHPGDH